MNEQVAQNISTEIAVSIENMNKWYGTFHVLRDIDLTVYQGERIVIAGPSGSGKSTLIRCINALNDINSGSIKLGKVHSYPMHQCARRAPARHHHGRWHGFVV